ncbi:MAG: type II toxin-antitoxin system VapC family toxin [Desulfurococcales archaeon]|nr:type II toxin-antitoxin system VapC family toxin [Desulfurococcales archaeon]
MIYIDTNVVISYVDQLDQNHGKARRLLDTLNGDRVVSELTKVELASAFSRAGFEDPLALSLYSIRKVDARIVNVDFNRVLVKAAEISHRLKLRTLDLLHITLASLIGAQKLVTFDRDILSKSNLISKFGIEVIKT